VEVRTVGSCEIRRGDSVLRPRDGLTFNLALYLALSRTSVRRDAVCELFWSVANRITLTRLRSVVATLKRRGFPVAPADGSHGLEVENVRADHDACHAIPLGNIGPVLGGVRGSGQFTMWLGRVKDEIEDVLVGHLVMRLRTHIDRGEWPGCADVARAILRVAPTNEDAMLALVESMAALGQKRRAMLLLRDYAKDLRSEGLLDDENSAGLSAVQRRLTEELRAHLVESLERIGTSRADSRVLLAVPPPGKPALG
jgi:DNA-binding SARP family transcriptional activator